MKRKCNLFYTAGEDTNFITFSNYTESLTGSFLATDMKIFPTKFICAYIEGLNDSNRGQFIKDVARYYENKLAFLRDHFLETDQDWQNNISPLYYLLNFICRYKTCEVDGIDPGKNDDEIFLNTIEEHQHFVTSHNYISFIGEITEQDYNGTYADNICVINSTNKAEYYDFPIGDETEICDPWKTYHFNLPKDYKYTSEYINNYAESKILYNECNKYLYSWYGVNKQLDEQGNEEDVYEYIGPKQYEDATPIFDIQSGTGDERVGYYYNIPKYSGLIRLTDELKAKRLQMMGETREMNEVFPENIKFNVIIPLYDLVNINYMNNTNVINEQYNEDKTLYFIPTMYNEKNNFISNIPLGIWFSGNNPIELKRDSVTGYAPSWSLVLSAQFKPFPYSNIIHTEITDSAKLDAYQTYAQILSRQNVMMDDVNKMLGRMNNIEHRIENVEGKFNTVGSSYSLDGLHEELHDMKNDIQEQIDSILVNLESIANLLWKYKQ